MASSCVSVAMRPIPQLLHRSWLPRTVTYCTGITSSRQEVNGVNLHYQRTGWGKHAVLLLPGVLGSSQTDFAPQLTYLNKELFTFVALDPRGYGRSIPPNRDFPPGFHERDAKDAVDLMKALKFERFSLLGWSDGGIIALIAAGTYPSHIQKLVVWGASAYVTDEDVKFYEGHRLEKQLHWPPGWDFPIQQLGVVRDVSNWSEKMRKPLENLYGKKYIAKIFSERVDALCQFTSRPDGNICRHLLPLIKCPTLIIHGNKDAMVRLFHPQFLHKQIKGSRLHFIPDGNHNLHLRYAEEFNKLVEHFLCQSEKKSIN